MTTHAVPWRCERHYGRQRFHEGNHISCVWPSAILHEPLWTHQYSSSERSWGRGQLKCDDTRAGTIFRLSAKWTSPLKSAEAPVQSTTGSRGVRISGTNAGYTTFGGSVKGTGYPRHSPVSPSLPFPCVTVCHHISTAVY